MPIETRYGKMYMKDSTGTLIQIVPQGLSTNTDYQGATASAAGVAGLVPAATSAEKDLYLKGDGSWGEGPYGTVVALGSGQNSLEPSKGSTFTKTITSSTTFTFEVVPNGKSCVFNLVLTNGGAYTVTWPSSVKWTGGNVPTLTASGVDVLTFLTCDGGTTWYGMMAVQGAA